MNLASIIGLVTGMFVIVFAVIFNQSTMTLEFTRITNFIDIPSVCITIGGSFASLLTMEKSLKSYVEKLSAIRLIFKKSKGNEIEVMKYIIELSNLARKEGLLSLEESIRGAEDEFTKKGVMLVIDGTDPEQVRRILENEVAFIEVRHNETISFWQKLSNLAPAWAMAGTVVGLINMMANLQDANAIGPSMSIALVTTFYGSLLANILCIPAVNKLKDMSAAEIREKELIVEGILCIQSGENPRIIEEKLKTFLKPSLRKEFELEAGGAVVG